MKKMLKQKQHSCSINSSLTAAGFSLIWKTNQQLGGGLV